VTRVLLFGKGGQVGGELLDALERRSPGTRAAAEAGRELQGYELVALDRAGCDLSDPDAVRATILRIRPQVVVNAAAWTAVDRAEAEPDACRRINADAPAAMAAAARSIDALLVHYSTDYVFDGRAHTPYREDDPVGPLGAYGRSKLEGEQAIAASGCAAVVLRTSWVYGLTGHNFLRTMLRLAGERAERGEFGRGEADAIGHVAGGVGHALQHRLIGVRGHRRMRAQHRQAGGLGLGGHASPSLVQSFSMSTASASKRPARMASRMRAISA
jgi:dTDP-4-dehydrorhamnose reductase